MANLNVEIISIGNELLAGITVNTNAAFIARRLATIGLTVGHISTIADTFEAIINALQTARNRAQIVITTGGLGPTPDDITKQALCKFFDVDLAFNQEVFEDVQKFLRHRKISLNRPNREQALIPRCEQILHNFYGTAPGLYFKRENTHFFFLPGVPQEVYHLMDKDVLPMLQNIFNLAPIRTHLLRTTGIPESRLIEKLSDLLKTDSHVRLAFLPRFRGVDLRFTMVDENPQTQKLFDQLVKQIRQRLQKYIFAEEEIEIEEAIGKILRDRGLTLSVAESFTGGLIGDFLTNIPGSSDYFLGAAVTYSNQSKIDLLNVKNETLQQHGAVSEATVQEMVRGVQQRFGSDCAIATTGIAGPGGATPTKPVGLCYIAARVGTKERVREFRFGNDRIMNKKRGAVAALELLRRLLLNIQ